MGGSEGRWGLREVSSGVGGKWGTAEWGEMGREEVGRGEVGGRWWGGGGEVVGRWGGGGGKWVQIVKYCTMYMNNIRCKYQLCAITILGHTGVLGKKVVTSIN